MRPFTWTEARDCLRVTIEFDARGQALAATTPDGSPLDGGVVEAVVGE
ncbi:MAG: hypothetical protein U0694_07555 [Anaerolineae bacterium]